MNARTLLACASLLGIAAACSAGVGAPAPIPSGQRDPPGTTNDPGGTKGDPGTTGQDPGGAGGFEQPGGGTSSGGSAGTPGTCPACDLSYQCTQSDGGVSSFTLKTDKGVCTIAGVAGSVFSCAGTVTFTTNTGAVTLQWQATSNGGFTVNGLTCSPESVQGGPPSGTGGGTTNG